MINLRLVLFFQSNPSSKLFIIYIYMCVYFLPKSVSFAACSFSALFCVIQPVRKHVRAVKTETLNLRQHWSNACNNSCCSFTLTDLIFAFSFSENVRKKKTKKSCRQLSDYNLTRSGFLGYLVVAAVFGKYCSVFLHFMVAVSVPILVFSSPWKSHEFVIKL